MAAAQVKACEAEPGVDMSGFAFTDRMRSAKE
jgi:hypothetical protein